MARSLKGKNEEKRGIFFRVLESEYQTLLKKSEPTGMNVSKFCKHVVLNKKISVPSVDRDIAHQLAMDLRKIGNNINQIAKQLNQGNKENEEIVSQLNKDMGDIWQLFNSVILKQ